MDVHGDRPHRVIPKDLLVQILLKLPVKSIVRFKSVCKAWCSLINSPSFIDQHMNKNSNLYVLINRLHEINDTTAYQFATRILSYDTLRAVSTRLFSPASPYPRRDDNVEFTNFFIKGCCNGLILVVDCDDEYDFDDDDYDFDHDDYDLDVEDDDDDDNEDDDVNYVLWNLAMGETKVLPSCLTRIQPKYRTNVLFETVGFGFDAESKDYKVVIIHKLMKDINSTSDSTHTVVEVYSLRTNSWKTVTTDLPDSAWITNLNGVFCNGKYYWTATIGTRFGLRRAIIWFDMSEEVIKTTHLPKDICMSTSPSSNIKRLLVVNESLAVVNCVRQNYHSSYVSNNDTTYDIWVLDKYGVEESWSKVFSFDFGQFTYIERLIGFWKDQMVFVQSSCGEELLLHDPVAQKFTGLQTFGQKMNLFYYRESLVPIKPKSTHLNIEEEDK